MNNTITVKAHPVTGAVFTPREANPEWGSYRVEAMSPTFDLRTGIMNINKRVAFVNMRTEDAKQLESWHNCELAHCRAVCHHRELTIALSGHPCLPL